MQITKEKMEQALLQTVKQAFALPEVAGVKVRDVLLERNAFLPEKVKEAVEKSWHDMCSDVDLCVMVRKAPEENVPEETYVRRVDRFGFSRENCLGMLHVPENRMWRLVTREGLRYDFGFVFIADQAAPKWQLPPERTAMENVSWPRKKTDAFWFVQVQALGKLFRGDYLIADHLAHMNLNETLVQQMVLRDMEKGTCHHRYGKKEAAMYETYADACPLQGEDDHFSRIAGKLYGAAMAYDDLMQRFYPGEEKRSPLWMELWHCYQHQGMPPEKEEKNMYCEHCQKIIPGDVCPECHRASREPEEMDLCFLTQRSHPWSDMLVDVLKQEGIPCLRQGSMGAGMMMMAGAYLDMESLYVLHKHLETAQRILNEMFGPETDENEAVRNEEEP